MRFPRPGGLRLVVVIALAALLWPMSQALSETAGRDYSRCIQSCNDARRSCNERCVIDCADMFPNSKTQRDACISACKDGQCLIESQDCKLTCKEIKNPYTEEP